MPAQSAARRAVFALLALGALVLALFAWNGLDPGWREPEGGRRPEVPPAAGAGGRPETLRVVAFNAAKLGAHRGGARFGAPADVRARIERVGALLREERVDLVFLSEVFLECAPCPVNQVVELCEAAGLTEWIYGDNYRFGLPFWRIRSGNAVLSRFPLEGLRVQDLPGGGPFFDPTGKRRLVWGRVRLGADWLDVGAVRNDSFDRANNARQTREILAELPAGEVLLAGDFNEEPGSPSLRALASSGRFAGAFEGPPTFPASRPRRRIDYVLAPAGWELVEERVLDTGVSDHLAVLAVYRLP